MPRKPADPVNLCAAQGPMWFLGDSACRRSTRA
jgi:hypothetical protein